MAEATPGNEYLKKLLDGGLINEGDPTKAGTPTPLVKEIESFLKEKNTPEDRMKAELTAEMSDLFEAIRERLNSDPKKEVRNMPHGDITDSKVEEPGETFRFRMISGGKNESYIDINYDDARDPKKKKIYSGRIISDGSFFINQREDTPESFGATKEHRVGLTDPADKVDPGTTPKTVAVIRESAARLYLSAKAPTKTA